MKNYRRRQFLGALWAGTVAAAPLTRSVAAQETPVVRMGNDCFDPIGLHVEPGTTVLHIAACGEARGETDRRIAVRAPFRWPLRGTVHAAPGFGDVGPAEHASVCRTDRPTVRVRVPLRNCIGICLQIPGSRICWIRSVRDLYGMILI